jgi:hypothetical protein
MKLLSACDTMPYRTNGALCHMELTGTELTDLTDSELKRAVKRAAAGESQIYVAWPGQWRSDLFQVDNICDYAKHLEVDCGHAHDSA